jgi:hypothetical protein
MGSILAHKAKTKTGSASTSGTSTLVEAQHEASGYDFEFFTYLSIFYIAKTHLIMLKRGVQKFVPPCPC